MKRQINSKELLSDIRSGMTDLDILKKYNFNARSFQAVLKQLVTTGMLTPAELDERMPLTEHYVAFEVFRCPVCKMPQFFKFDECPQCGVILSKFDEKQSESKTHAQMPALQTGSTVGNLKAAKPKAIDAFDGNEEVDTSQWTAYESVKSKSTEPVEARTFSTKKNHIKITVQIHIDLFNELNALGGDLSEAVSEAVAVYLKQFENNEI